MSNLPTRHLYLHSEDFDGWLALPNRPLLPLYEAFLSGIQGLARIEGGVHHEIQVVLNSGKAPEYLEREAVKFGGRYVISGNGAAWREVGGPTRRFGPPNPHLESLRRLLDLPSGVEDVVRISMSGRSVEMALEGKQDADGDIVLSFFPEQGPVAHRWSFRQGTDRAELKAYLEHVIREHGLALHIAPPHADGAVDVLPLIDGRPVGKWTLPHLAREMFPGVVLHPTHGGDAVNDLSAMEAEGVTPLTAANCPEVADLVRLRGGVVARREAPGGALVECYGELARRGWYGPLSAPVAELCSRFAPDGTGCG